MDEQQIAAQLEHVEFEVKIGLKKSALPKVFEQIQDLHAKALSQYQQNFVAKLFPDAPAVEASVLKGGASQRLENTYFDTEDDALFSECYAGLRLRRFSQGKNLHLHPVSADDKVEQTLKLKGKESGAAHSHLEYNVDVSGSTAVPSLELFSEVTWPDTIDIAEVQANLRPRYITDFFRSAYTFVLPGVGTVEMAFDDGVIHAGSVERELGELEIEVKDCKEMAHLFVAAGKDLNIEDIKFYLNEALYAYVACLDAAIVEALDLHIFFLEPLSKLKRAVLLKEHAHFLQGAPAPEIYVDSLSLDTAVFKADVTPLARAEAFSAFHKSVMAMYGKARLFFPGYEKDIDRFVSLKLEAALAEAKNAFGEKSEDVVKALVLSYLSSLIAKKISYAYYESAYIANLNFYRMKSELNGVPAEHYNDMCRFVAQVRAAD